MKPSPGYIPALCCDLLTRRKLVHAFVICVTLPLSLVAQDSLQLRSFANSNIHYLPLVFADAKVTTNWQSPKKGPYLFAHNICFSPDTAAINDRYKPGANPQRLGYLTNLPTEEQMKAQTEQRESIGWATGKLLYQTIFRRGKIPAVKPTF